MTLVIDNREKQGLVQRERNSKDRCMILVPITLAGSNLISKMIDRTLF